MGCFFPSQRIKERKEHYNGGNLRGFFTRQFVRWCCSLPYCDVAAARILSANTWHSNAHEFIVEFGEDVIIIDSTLYMINLERNYNTIFFFLTQDGAFTSAIEMEQRRAGKKDWRRCLFTMIIITCTERIILLSHLLNDLPWTILHICLACFSHIT